MTNTLSSHQDLEILSPKFKDLKILMFYGCSQIKKCTSWSTHCFFVGNLNWLLVINKETSTGILYFLVPYPNPKVSSLYTKNENLQPEILLNVWSKILIISLKNFFYFTEGGYNSYFLPNWTYNVTTQHRRKF